MSDIVERQLADNLNWAADEIERLRERVEELEGALKKVEATDGTTSSRGFSGDQHADCVTIARRALTDQEEDANG